MSPNPVGIIICELNEPTKDSNPGLFYFREIAESNDSCAGNTTLLTSGPADKDKLFSHEIYRGIFTSQVGSVNVRMAMLRFPHNTDLVVHMRSENEDAQDMLLIDEMFQAWIKSLQATEQGLK